MLFSNVWWSWCPVKNEVLKFWSELFIYKFSLMWAFCKGPMVQVSVQVQRPEYWCSRTGENGCPIWSKDSKVALPLPFCSIRPSRDQCPFTQMRKIFTQSADSNANLCRNTLTDKPRKNVLQAMWATFNPVKLTHKISHYRIWGFKGL